MSETVRQSWGAGGVGRRRCSGQAALWELLCMDPFGRAVLDKPFKQRRMEHLRVAAEGIMA